MVQTLKFTSNMWHYEP